MNKLQRTGVALAWIAATGVLAAIAHGLLLTRFMIYDDEGYVLWSVRQFCAGEPLYTSVFSQYGPFFYALYGTVHRVTGLVFDNETGRLLTLGYWVGASLLCGWIAHRLTRSALAGLASAGFAFAVLADMTCEPFHPGGLLALLTVAGAAAGLGFTGSRPRRAWIAIGSLGTAIALTKINVGAFFLFAAASWLAMHHRSDSTARAWARLVAACLIAAPLLLMRAHFPSPWVALYTLVFVASGLGLLVVFHQLPAAAPAPRRWLAQAALPTVAAMLALAAIAAAAAGTSLSQLWHAVVLAPLRHPGIYWFPIDWQRGAIAATIVTTVALAADWRWKNHPHRPAAIASLRLVAGAMFLWHGRESANGFLHPFTFQFAPAFAWLMATPLDPKHPDTAATGRSWIAWLSLWQMLQVYPVAGSQQAWAAFTWTPLLIAGWWDAVRFWQEKLGPRPHAMAAGATALVAATAIAVGLLGKYSRLYYRAAEPLGLPGAASLRLQTDLATTLRVLHRNATAHAGVLSTYPGMFSFNIWTAKPTPTAANVTHWFSLLDAAQQKAIADRLESDPNAVVIVHRTYVQYLITSGFAPQGLLKDFVFRRFAPALRIGNYDLWVHRGRTIAPLATARIAADPAGKFWLTLTLSPASRPVAELRFRRVVTPETDVGKIAFREAPAWYVTPIAETGRPSGATTRHTAPFTVAQLSRVQLPLPEELASLELAATEIVALDAAGEVIEAFRFNQAPGLSPVDVPPTAN